MRSRARMPRSRRRRRRSRPDRPDSARPGVWTDQAAGTATRRATGFPQMREAGADNGIDAEGAVLVNTRRDRGRRGRPDCRRRRIGQRADSPSEVVPGRRAIRHCRFVGPSDHPPPVFRTPSDGIDPPARVSSPPTVKEIPGAISLLVPGIAIADRTLRRLGERLCRVGRAARHLICNQVHGGSSPSPGTM